MDTSAIINTSSLSGNYRYFAKNTKSRVICVVKSDAYGHGLRPVVRALVGAGARHFAVATLKDAARLLFDDVGQTVINLSHPEQSFRPVLLDSRVVQSVYSLDLARDLDCFARAHGKMIKCHLKIDVGMGRLGFHFKDGMADALKVFDFKNLSIIGLYAHFSSAFYPKSQSTINQYDSFLQAKNALLPYFKQKPFTHIGSTSAFFNFNGLICEDGIRIGMGLYGYNGSFPSPWLTPVMTLRSRLIHLYDAKSPFTVGYGGTILPPQVKRVGVLPVGYYNGLFLDDNFTVDVNGVPCKILGKACMNHCMIDLTDACCKVGDAVTLFGCDKPILNGHTYDTLCLAGRLNKRSFLSG